MSSCGFGGGSGNDAPREDRETPWMVHKVLLPLLRSGLANMGSKAEDQLLLPRLPIGIVEG